MGTLHERIRSLEMLYEVDKTLNVFMLIQALQDIERELIVMHTRMTAFAELYSKTMNALNSIELQLQGYRLHRPDDSP